MMTASPSIKQAQAALACFESARMLCGVKKFTGKRSPETLLSLSAAKLDGNSGATTAECNGQQVESQMPSNLA